MLRIANIIEDARLGGPQIRMAKVAGRLDRSRFETTVILPEDDSAGFTGRLESEGVQYKKFPLHRLTKEPPHLFKFVLFFFYEVFLLWRFFRRERFDIVHVSGGAWQWKGVLAGRLAGTKILWELNDTQMPIYIKMIFKLASFLVHSYIVVSNRTRRYYVDSLKLKNKEIFEIQSPVDCAFFDPAITPQDGRLEEVGGIKVTTVCNVNPIKGLEDFVMLAAELNKSHQGLNFFIVGRVFSSTRKYFEKLTSLMRALHVRNLFFYEGSDAVERILQSTDIYVCSSKAEASPLAVWEAMAMAKPIVSTDVGDVSSFVRNGEAGVIVSAGKLLPEGVKTLLADMDIARQYGRKAREIALHELDISVCVKKHEEVYQKVGVRS